MKFYDLDASIEHAIRNKTIIPKVIYNIEIDFIEIDKTIWKYFRSDANSIADHKDIEEVYEILKASVHSGLCRALLSCGISFYKNNNYKDAICRIVNICLDSAIDRSSSVTLIDMDDENKLLAIDSAIINTLDKIIKNIKDLDNDVIEIQSFFSYLECAFITKNNIVMYKSFADRVISMLRF